MHELITQDLHSPYTGIQHQKKKKKVRSSELVLKPGLSTFYVFTSHLVPVNNSSLLLFESFWDFPHDPVVKNPYLTVWTTHIWSLVLKDPTCQGASQLASQLLKLVYLEPVLRN